MTGSSAAAPELDQLAELSDNPRSWGQALRVFLAHGSPRILIVLALLALGARLVVGAWSLWDLAVVGIIALLWPLNEWLIHVFILHYKPRKIFGRELDFELPRSHREHHRNPWRLDLVFIPMNSYAYSIPLLLLLYWSVTPTSALALTGIATHLLLALNYEWVHFIVHTKVKPKGAYYRRLFRNHRLHHFKNEHYWYGVSMLAADRPLSTRPDQANVAPSPTVRELLGRAGTR